MSARLNREVFGLKYRYYTIDSLKRALEAASVSYELKFSQNKEQLFDLLTGLEDTIYDDELRQTLSTAVRKHYNAGKKIISRNKDLASAFEEARGIYVQDDREDMIEEGNNNDVELPRKDRELETGEPSKKSRRIVASHEDSIPDIECEICCTTKPSYEFSMTNVTERCKHPQTICLSCIANSIHAQIQQGQWRSLQCPLCPESLEKAEVEHYATQDTFTWYDNLIESHQHEDDPTFIKCLRDGCGSGQFHDPVNGETLMICESCDYQMCIKHQLPWHEGRTCKEYDKIEVALAKAEKASQKVLKKISKQCPQCGVHIQKDNGCNHMTCICCDADWDWATGNQID